MLSLKRLVINSKLSRIFPSSRITITMNATDNVMESSTAAKRQLPQEEVNDRPNKQVKQDNNSLNTRLSRLRHGKGRPIPPAVLSKLSEEDVGLLENVTTSCTDLEKIKAAISLRIKHRLSIRLPEDNGDSTYYCDEVLRRVYPYQYLYQTYAKRRWIGRKLKDIMRLEFRDISDEQLKARFDDERVLVNGKVAPFDYILRDTDFICNRTHRHELPVLATPIKFIFRDQNILVIDKPPSVPIHPCGRYRHNSVLNILEKEYGMPDVKVVHRLDRLVSGVLIIALNSGRARALEEAIKNRNVQKEYVCRVAGEFPFDDKRNNGEIDVHEPLEIIPGKIGITVVLPEGKPSQTTFRRLNYNGKTSAVLCKPKTGRMHQIRVHLQYLGHPIVNDTLYNCDAFGPERGKGGRYGKTIRQLSADVVSRHRASTWLITDNTNDDFGTDGETPVDELEIKVDSGDGKLLTDSASQNKEIDERTVKFIDENERQETLAALDSYFTSQTLKDLQKKWPYEQERMIEDQTCRDCHAKYHDPPLRSLFLYLHALKYSGEGWSYESELPTWARESWEY